MKIANKVEPGVIAGRLTKNANSSSNPPAIDAAVLEMLRGLSLPPETNTFGEALASYADELASALKKAHQSLAACDELELEQTALDVSQHSLRVGAVNMLRSSFELRNLARLKDFHQAQTIVENLELEYLKVRQELATYS